MNKFPYRRKRKGKRPPQDIGDNGENIANANATQESVRDNAQAKFGTDANRTSENTGDSSQLANASKFNSHRPRSNRDDAYRVGGAPQPNHYLNAEKPAENNARRKNNGEQVSADKNHNNAVTSDVNGSRVRSKNRSKSAEKGSQFLRNLRAPVKPTPEASYTPKSRAESRPRAKAGKQYYSSQGLYAALDLGTNNCRLLVAQPQERGRFRVVDGFSKIVRLGEGLGHSGSLRQDAMDRAVGALKTCSEKLAFHNIKRHRLIATEACRQADNGEVFLQRVKAETGLDLEIINRQTEASLAAEGCGALMDKKADAGVLFDIGGGSSELMLVNRRLGPKRISEQIVSWTSLPVGVVTLSERFGGQTVTRDSFKAMVREVLNMLENFEGKNELARIWKNGRVHLLGTSGTVTTLAGIHLELPRYDRRKVDGLWLTDTQIDEVLESLLSMDYKQRSQSPCVGKERADLVMAGCAILEAIRITWPSKRLRVADRGLREGILTQMMDRDGAWIKGKKDRWSKKRQSRNHQNKMGNNNGS